MNLWLLQLFLCCNLRGPQMILSGASDVPPVDMSWIDQMIPKDYDQNNPPGQNGKPAEVLVDISPWTIGDLSIEHKYFEVSVYVTMRWLDYRLTIKNEDGNMINVPLEQAKKLWTPQVNFRNCMDCSFVSFDVNSDILMLNGSYVLYFVRRNPKLLCDFHIASYPMDTHCCHIEVVSTSLKSAVVLLDDCKRHRFLRNSTVPQFKVVNHQSSGTCSVPDEIALYSSCVEYTITFVRQIAFHLMLTYTPSLLIVVLTWVAFWLDVDMAAPRVALGLTSLLTLATQFAQAQKSLPPVSYVKAIDIWMVACIFMVFASLIEYAIAFAVKDLTHQNKVQTMKRIPPFSQTSFIKKSLPLENKKSKIDEASRFAFPIAFVVFNLCYWGYYMSKYP